MMGTFRMVKPDGTLAVQEALAIVAEENGVFMRVRHFDAAMTAREEKDAPIVLATGADRRQDRGVPEGVGLEVRWTRSPTGERAKTCSRARWRSRPRASGRRFGLR